MATTNSFDKSDTIKCFICDKWTPIQYTVDRMLEGGLEQICITCAAQLDARAEQLDMEMEIYKEIKEGAHEQPEIIQGPRQDIIPVGEVREEESNSNPESSE